MYEEDYYDEENAEAMRQYQYSQRRRVKALNSYPEGEPYVYCDKCGALLAYTSGNFHAGYCVDGCDE